MEENLTHGGDWAGYWAQRGSMPLDFSANISPLGLPAGVREAVIASLDTAQRYPDPLCRALRDAIGESEGVEPAWVLCGSGAADLIYRAVLAKRPKRALVTAPTFAEYEAALDLVGCKTERFVLREKDNFDLTAGILEAIGPDTDMVFLCQPNNPTGRSIPRRLLLAVLDRCRQVDALLVMDECFCDFLLRAADASLKGALNGCANLLILKAFTKLYAMAGLRLGYCLCGDGELLARMRAAGQPWAVSGPAQAAGIAALKETDYAHCVLANTAKERIRLARGLADLGLRVVPGEANYLLFYSNTPLLGPLRERGILIRDCSNYHGLGPGWYRVAVRKRGDNLLLMDALKKILKGGAL